MISDYDANDKYTMLEPFEQPEYLIRIGILLWGLESRQIFDSMGYCVGFVLIQIINYPFVKIIFQFIAKRTSGQLGE